MSNDERVDNRSRRSFVKKAAYVAPVIITLDAMPAIASHKCSGIGDNGVGDGIDPQPPGNPPINDGPGTGLGNPGRRGGGRGGGA